MKIYLDLLPEDRKNELKRNKAFWTIIRRELLFLFPIIVFIVILFDIYFVLGIQKDSVAISNSGEQSNGQYKELGTYESGFKQVNDLVIFLARAKRGHLQWSHVLGKVSEIMPDGVYVTEISNKDHQVFLAGKSKSREALIALKDALSNSGCADNVNVPLSNLVNKTDIDFQMDFTVKDTCLKNQN